MTMIQKLSFFVAVFLIALGVVGYVITDMVSVTALIPSFLGVLIGFCAWWASSERWRKHAMHVAMVFAVIGIAGSFGGLLQLGSVIDGSAERPEASVARSITAVVLIVYMVMGVRSFIQARKERNKEQGQEVAAVS